MTRILLSGTLLFVFGCAMPAERMPLRPLPENGQVLPYAELLTRIRAQSNKTLDTFFMNRWDELKEMAEGIEQTSRFLSKAEEVPEKNRKNLKEVTDDLGKNAQKLRDAAAARNVKEATDALQQIISRVHALALTDENAKQPKKE